MNFSGICLDVKLLGVGLVGLPTFHHSLRLACLRQLGLSVVTDTPRWALETTLEAWRPWSALPQFVFSLIRGDSLYIVITRILLVICIEMPPPRRWFIPLYLSIVCFCEGAHSPHLSSPIRELGDFLFCVSSMFVCVLSLLFIQPDRRCSILLFFTKETKAK